MDWLRGVFLQGMPQYHACLWYQLHQSLCTFNMVCCRGLLGFVSLYVMTDQGCELLHQLQSGSAMITFMSVAHSCLRASLYPVNKYRCDVSKY